LAARSDPDRWQVIRRFGRRQSRQWLFQLFKGKRNVQGSTWQQGSEKAQEGQFADHAAIGRRQLANTRRSCRTAAQKVTLLHPELGPMPPQRQPDAS
jgi:hypothetical protein